MELEEELNLTIFNILNSFLLIINKNKKLFSLLFILSFLLSTIYNFSKKDLWMGKSIFTLNFEDGKNFLKKEEGNMSAKSQEELNSLISRT